MPINPGVVTSPIERASLIGQHAKLLSVDALAHPENDLFGATEGPDRDLLFSVFTPDVDVEDLLRAALEAHAPEVREYAVPGILAILVTKPQDEDLAANHFMAPKVRVIISRFGMPAGIMEDHVRDLRHAK